MRIVCRAHTWHANAHSITYKDSLSFHNAIANIQVRIANAVFAGTGGRQ